MKRPSGEDFSLQNYTAEFAPSAWIMSFVAYISLWLGLFVFLTLSQPPMAKNALSHLTTSLNVILLAIINKVSLMIKLHFT